MAMMRHISSCWKLLKMAFSPSGQNGGMHVKKAGTYASWAKNKMAYNYHLEKYGRIPQFHKPRGLNKLPTKRSASSRLTKPQLQDKVKALEARNQELEAELADVTSEMHQFADEVCIANVCLSKIGVVVCCVLSAPAVCSVCSGTQKNPCLW